jgi:hypothetical protein
MSESVFYRQGYEIATSSHKENDVLGENALYDKDRINLNYHKCYYMTCQFSNLKMFKNLVAQKLFSDLVLRGYATLIQNRP